ncbi:MAG: rRNA pseudouridine synthase [Oscillospiraceae bacterium]|nr:rRNA pseudouridine synthase [Oscillospiraceae bacterium]
MEERLQKLLSQCGVGSRRAMEEWITAGRVTVNGTVSHLGDRADLDRDEVCVDGVPIRPEGQRLYLMLNKPRGYVSTLSDERGRKTVAQLVDGCGRRVWPVGRLDQDSEGLLLMTDDGELTQHLIHPSHEVDKEYLVWVMGDVKKGLPVLAAPMELDGQLLSPTQVRQGKTSGGVTQLSVTIHQGKNRQVRRMCAKAGLTVLRLKRIREGSVDLDRALQPGQWRELTREEIAKLKEESGGFCKK